MSSDLENIIRRPRRIYLQTRFAHEVTPTNDIPCRDDGRISAVRTSRPCNDVHPRDVVGLKKGREPFDICQDVWEGSEMRR